ncbi:ATP-grasp peptide maturase system methyltransferase [Streptomonospora sp. S1-112]|uniref:Protein-L-isoaspartate O-methyltransferase n=1 Tax=Streptomonospora mangrovi TaxID=2883123 RepID=A0A9X3SPG1_9ACTN|nr:ATP-grasp peptide maturase system methyltransferase [Streptomonospora mangrovi]MDA0565856.1 ATP-grasp peptide maturase system methyltransferase [Streptomonospora mangrovi]
MTLPADLDADAARLRRGLVRALAEEGVLGDPAWRQAVAAVPRHRFVPGFYLPGEEPDPDGLTVWEPVTADLDHARWLAAAYSDTTLITQFDGDEPDWARPAVRHGGAPTSSSTLPSLVVGMWADAEVAEGHNVLEIGTGTGYSTALACERLGSAGVTSIEVDGHRLRQAASSLHACGYIPALAVADGLYGYRPRAPFDRIVAACSFRAVPPALLAQARPGGKILLTLSGWLYGYARVLLTVDADGTAHGRLLPGTVSFMAVRTHAPPSFGNPAHWAALASGADRPTRHAPDRLTHPTVEAFHLRFLAQCAVPDAQMATVDGHVHLVDVVTGSVAVLSAQGGDWRVRQGGPVALWDRVEAVVDAYDAAGAPEPSAFTLHVDAAGQYLRHPGMPSLRLPQL